MILASLSRNIEQTVHKLIAHSSKITFLHENYPQVTCEITLHTKQEVQVPNVPLDLLPEDTNIALWIML